MVKKEDIKERAICRERRSWYSQRPWFHLYERPLGAEVDCTEF